jgi:hypothetical protein
MRTLADFTLNCAGDHRCFESPTNTSAACRSELLSPKRLWFSQCGLATIARSSEALPGFEERFG